MKSRIADFSNGEDIGKLKRTSKMDEGGKREKTRQGGSVPSQTLGNELGYRLRSQELRKSVT